MHSSAFVKKQIPFSPAVFGRGSLGEGLASASEPTPDEILAKLAKLEASRKARPRKHPKSLEQLVPALPPVAQLPLQLMLRRSMPHKRRLGLRRDRAARSSSVGVSHRPEGSRL